MKLIKGIHLNGTDTKKRFWRVPEALEQLPIKKGQHAIVETSRGEAEIKILQVFISKEPKVKFRNYEMLVTKKVISIQ